MSTPFLLPVEVRRTLLDEIWRVLLLPAPDEDPGPPDQSAPEVKSDVDSSSSPEGVQ